MELRAMAAQDNYKCKAPQALSPPGAEKLPQLSRNLPSQLGNPVPRAPVKHSKELLWVCASTFVSPRYGCSLWTYPDCVR